MEVDLGGAGHIPGLAAGERERCRVPAVLAEPSEHRDVRASVPRAETTDGGFPWRGRAAASPNHSINRLWLNPPRGAVCPAWVPGEPGAPRRGAGDLPYPSPGQREPVPAPSLRLGVQTQPAPPRLSTGKLICPQQLSWRQEKCLERGRKSSRKSQNELVCLPGFSHASFVGSKARRGGFAAGAGTRAGVLPGAQ